MGHLRRLATSIRSLPRPILGALLGTAALVAGVGGYLAMVTPPYQPDESSHTGYVLVLMEGRLPDLDTDVPEQVDDTLDASLRRPWPFSTPKVHVAANPPFPYLVAIPPTAAARALGSGPLIGLRLADLAGVVATVGLAYLLGRELGGRDHLVGAITAVLSVAPLSIPMVSSAAAVDGLALMATTGVLWATARVARDPSGERLLTLGLWCAVAAAVRPMSLGFALVAGVLGLIHRVRVHRAAGLPSAVLRLAAPTVVLTGWFYVLNQVRYGDPAGRAEVLEQGGYSSTTSVIDVLFSTESFIRTFPYVVTAVYGRGYWSDAGWREYLVSAGAVAVVLGATLLAVVDSRRARAGSSPHRAAPDRSRPLSPASWVSMIVLGLAPVFLLASHVSSGGAGHARYLMPIVPVVAAGAATLLVRLNPWVAVGVATAAVVSQLARVEVAGDLRYPVPELFSPELRRSVVGQPFRTLALLLAAGGTVVLVGGLVAAARARTRAPVRAPNPGDAA